MILSERSPLWNEEKTVKEKPVYYPACSPAYILYQYGERRHGCKEPPVSDGHADVGMTLSIYTHIGDEKASAQMLRIADSNDLPAKAMEK